MGNNFISIEDLALLRRRCILVLNTGISSHNSPSLFFENTIYINLVVAYLLFQETIESIATRSGDAASCAVAVEVQQKTG